MIASWVSYGMLIFLNSSVCIHHLTAHGLEGTGLSIRKSSVWKKVKTPNSIWFNKEQYRSLYWKGWSYVKYKNSSVWHFSKIQSSSSPKQNRRIKFQINDQSIIQELFAEETLLTLASLRRCPVTPRSSNYNLKLICGTQQGVFKIRTLWYLQKDVELTEEEKIPIWWCWLICPLVVLLSLLLQAVSWV